MLSRDLKRLSDTFEGWSRGKPYPTEADWTAFQRELRLLAAKAAMTELGVDPDFFKIAAAINEPGSNVTLFPTPRQRQIDLMGAPL